MDQRGRKVEMLEVESEKERERRISMFIFSHLRPSLHFSVGAALEKLNSTSSSSTSGFSTDSRLPTFDFGDRKTYPVTPPHQRSCLIVHSCSHTDLSTVLSRVQEFLPQMEASNAVLSRRARDDPQSIDIETIEEGAHQYIEMVSHTRPYEPLLNICLTLPTEPGTWGV